MWLCPCVNSDTFSLCNNTIPTFIIPPRQVVSLCENTTNFKKLYLGNKYVQVSFKQIKSIEKLL